MTPALVTGEADLVVRINAVLIGDLRIPFCWIASLNFHSNYYYFNLFDDFSVFMNTLYLEKEVGFRYIFN